MLDIHIRKETPDDYYAVEELTREAFWRGFWGEGQTICDEHLLVHKLRNVEAFVPELSLVAEIDNKIVGHIIYSKSKVVDDNGAEHELLTFGPLSTHPEFKWQGVGRALMKHSFEEARNLGFRAIIIFGYPDYYPKVGFRPAGEFGISTAWGSNFDAFMALELYPRALDGIKGKYYLDPVYEQLTQEDTLEFDKKFPPKEAFVHIPIEALLNRLEPDARKEIEDLNFKTLAILASKSENSLRALPSVCDESIEIIKAVLREHGYAWGK